MSTTDEDRFLEEAMRLAAAETEALNAEKERKANENLVDVNYTFFVKNLVTGFTDSFRETHSMRHFSLPEIDILAEMSGFQRVDAHEFLSKKSPSENSWGVCIILKKK